MADILTLPVQRKRGRRRTNPVAGATTASILNFDAGNRLETPEQRLARIDEAMNRMARALLTAVRVTREVAKIANPDSGLAE